MGVRIPRRAGSSLVGFVAVLSALMPVPAQAEASAPIEAPVLRADGRTSALVHVRSDATVSAGVAAAGNARLDVGTIYDEIAVFVAYGTADAFRVLAADPSIEAIEANRKLTFFTDSSHTATRGQDLLDGGTALPDGSRIDGSGVGVAIVDSGIDGTHPDLDDRVVQNVKIVCASHATSVYVGPVLIPDECLHPAGKVVVGMDDTDSPSAGGHGTHVAGIVAGTGAASKANETDPFGRYHGAAPGASLYGVSIGTAVTVENALDGLRWVLDNHDQVTPRIKVVNNSWGTDTHQRYPAGGPKPGDFYYATWKLQDLLIEAGITVVQAAGNTGGNGAAATTSPQCVNQTPGVVCVANYWDGNSGSRNGNIDGSSSRGNADPALADTWPDVAAPGTRITSTCRPHLPICHVDEDPTTLPDNDFYSVLTGTSMAAPHVAGIAAQLYQSDPSLTPAAIEDLLEDTAYKFTWGERYASVDPTNPDDASSFEKGHGLVDATAAVRALLLGESPEPDPEWPVDPELPPLPPPGPEQRFYFHSTARINTADIALNAHTFSTSEPQVTGGALAPEVWFPGGVDPAWAGRAEGPIQSVKLDFWVKSTDESTHDFGVPPLFQGVLAIGSGADAQTYRLPVFAARTSAIDSVPRRITESFSHYLVPDGPDEGTAEDLERLNVDPEGRAVTLRIVAGWFHHVGAVVYDSPEFPSGFMVNEATAAGCAGSATIPATETQLFLHSSTRNGNVDAAVGSTSLDAAAPTSSADARIEDVPLLRNPLPAAAVDPIWREGTIEGAICSLTIDIWQKQTLDELILQQVHYLVTLWIDDRPIRLPALEAAGNQTSDATRITHEFTTMLNDFGDVVPLLIDPTGSSVAIEIAGRYVDADLETTIYYDSIARPSNIVINAGFSEDPEPLPTALVLEVRGNGSKRTLVATLLDDAGIGLEGKTIFFFVDGAEVGSAVTNDTGTALLAPSGKYPGHRTFAAEFRGDEGHLPSGAEIAT